jgi:hypothetical protein
MVSHGGFIAYYKHGTSGLGLEAQRAAVAQYLNGGDWRITAEFTEIESEGGLGWRVQLPTTSPNCNR